MAPSTDASTSGRDPFSKSRPNPLGISTTIWVLPLLRRRSPSAAEVIGDCTEKYREPEKPSSNCRLSGVLSWSNAAICKFSISKEIPYPKANIRMIGPKTAKASRIGSRKSSTVSRRA